MIMNIVINIITIIININNIIIIILTLLILYLNNNYKSYDNNIINEYIITNLVLVSGCDLCMYVQHL